MEHLTPISARIFFMVGTVSIVGIVYMTAEVCSYSPQFTYRPVVPVAAMPEKPVGKEEPKPSKFAYGKAKKDSSSNPPPEF